MDYGVIDINLIGEIDEILEASRGFAFRLKVGRLGKCPAFINVVVDKGNLVRFLKKNAFPGDEIRVVGRLPFDANGEVHTSPFWIESNYAFLMNKITIMDRALNEVGPRVLQENPGAIKTYTE